MFHNIRYVSLPWAFNSNHKLGSLIDYKLSLSISKYKSCTLAPQTLQVITYKEAIPTIFNMKLLMISILGENIPIYPSSDT
jgi:hypothetical protein